MKLDQDMLASLTLHGLIYQCQFYKNMSKKHQQTSGNQTRFISYLNEKRTNISAIGFYFICTLYYPFREIWAALPG